ncbi:hypothetical protein BaRGS_00009779 [Batillaria attramentaria]|uniref:Uncharacterized protein n=1 Tax=Batillaria attramentaria TaxID=370345 RepID=A0ABD0LHS8_9CAEN
MTMRIAIECRIKLISIMLFTPVVKSHTVPRAWHKLEAANLHKKQVPLDSALEELTTHDVCQAHSIWRRLELRAQHTVDVDG